jgi:hypothetical protein
MKKLLSLITIMILVIGLGACAPSQDYNYEEDLQDLQEQITAQQEEIDALNERIDNLVVSVGLNGQVSIYENQSSMFSRMTYLDLKEKDVLNKLKFPDYIWDLNGDYVDVQRLGNLLTQKYFGESSTNRTGFQFRITMNEDGMSDNEIVARLSLMIMELSHYDFYTIDTSELYIMVLDGGTKSITVRTSLLVSPDYNLSPEIFYESMLDTRIYGMSVDASVVANIVQGHITNGTFDGFVLPNYK